MTKLKTNKSISSRVKITGRKKLMRRATNQSHFNAKVSGKDRRLKRQASSVAKTDVKAINQFLPYK